LFKAKNSVAEMLLLGAGEALVPGKLGGKPHIEQETAALAIRQCLGAL